MFLLVPTHPGCPGQFPQSRKTVVCVCVMISEEWQKVMLNAVRWPCGVCGGGVNNNSIQCTRCQKWEHGKCSGIKGSMYKVMKSFVCKGCVNPATSTGCNANLELIDTFCYLGDLPSVDRDADAAVETRIRIGWNKLRQLVPLHTNKDISLIVGGRLYSSCVQSSMLHGSEAWPRRKENNMALKWAEMRIVSWMCGVKLQDRVPSKGLSERLGIDDIIWYYSKTSCDGMGMYCEKRQ